MGPRVGRPAQWPAPRAKAPSGPRCSMHMHMRMHHRVLAAACMGDTMADALASHHEELDAPVAPPVEVVVGNGLVRPVADDLEPIGRDAALVGEEATHCLRSLA